MPTKNPGSKDPRIDAYIAKAAPFAKPILKHIRSLVHRACPQVEETIKWTMPHFVYNGNLCFIGAFKQHCTFGFWHSGMHAITQKYHEGGNGLGQFGKITTLAELPTDSTFTKWIKQAVKLNESGVKPKRTKPGERPPIEVPADFIAALKKNKKSLATFEAFSYSHKKEYVQWILEAKREETRVRRIAMAVKQIAEGKSQGWKYEKK